MFPILQLGPLAIQVPGLAVLVGLWAGLSLAEREAARLGLKPDQLYTLVMVGLLSGIVGGRLIYVARYLDAYVVDPLGALSFNPATLAVPEGVGVGLLVAWVYGARQKLPLRATLDALAPGAAALLVAFALAHLASGDAFGAPARLPWSVYLWDDYRHPAQVYELIAGVIGLGVWGAVRARRLPAGCTFLIVLIWSALAGIFLEAFRGDSQLGLAGLRVAQVWGLGVLGAGLGLLRRWGRDQLL